MKADKVAPGSSSKKNNKVLNTVPKNSLFHNQEEYGPHFIPKTIMAKLEFGENNDRYEKEADQVSQKAGQAFTGDSTGETMHGRVANFMEGNEHGGFLSRSKDTRGDSVGGGTNGTSHFESQLQQTRGGGRSLDDYAQQKMEAFFNRDFSQVRVHTDQNAGEMSKGIGAEAFTSGSDIYFNHGKYNVNNNAGQKLLAHELTHVVQQQGGGKSVQRSPAATVDELLKLMPAFKESLLKSIDRYQNLLTKNLSLFLIDVMNAGKSEALNGSFGKSLLKTIVGDVGALGIVSVGAKSGTKLLRLFFCVSDVKVIGGVLGFFVGSILETVIGELLSSTEKVVSASAGNILNLVVNVINPHVSNVRNKLVADVDKFLEKSRTGKGGEQYWGDLIEQVKSATLGFQQSYPNINDQSMYRHLALQFDVYRGRTVAAEEKLPKMLQGKHRTWFSFSIQNRVLLKGERRINVTKDKSTVVAKIDSLNAIKNENGILEKTELNSHYREIPPDSHFYVMLIKPDSFLGVDTSSEYHISRKFQVGKRGFGVWYNVPKGTYAFRIYRTHKHPIALCGKGDFYVL